MSCGAAQRGFDDSEVPLLGVMGAFVFAAQMINSRWASAPAATWWAARCWPVRWDRRPASVVMTAILAIQALVFQDGGMLALGANVINMAIVGRAGRISAVLSVWARALAARRDFRGRGCSRCWSARCLRWPNC